jgi:hypothetical protein
MCATSLARTTCVVPSPFSEHARAPEWRCHSSARFRVQAEACRALASWKRALECVSRVTSAGTAPFRVSVLLHRTAPTMPLPRAGGILPPPSWAGIAPWCAYLIALYVQSFVEKFVAAEDAGDLLTSKRNGEQGCVQPLGDACAVPQGAQAAQKRSAQGTCVPALRARLRCIRILKTSCARPPCPAVVAAGHRAGARTSAPVPKSRLLLVSQNGAVTC